MSITISYKPLDVARDVLARNLNGEDLGLTSVCSAHPLVLRAALISARDSGQVALLEATCNQVNQEGGYTGMRPADFAALVDAAAEAAGVPKDLVLLGGDHLGPQPWRECPSIEAMDRAAVMVAGYAKAGFGKIHLDCSMRCADDPDPLPESVIARRAAHLAAVAERAADSRPIYVIGTEVPPPGGMGEGHDIVATDPAHVARTFEQHREAFAAAGHEDAFSRICAIVVQPGLDFGNESVVHFNPASARELSAQVISLQGAVFEAHSTDHQRPPVYGTLVNSHFAILKVGPAATFALREAIYALELMARELLGNDGSSVRASLEQAMQDDPRHWHAHYAGNPVHVAWLRHFGWSDRIRYYWAVPDVQEAVSALFKRLDGVAWPLPLVSQYLPGQFDALADGRLASSCQDIVIDAVCQALAPYYAASRPHPFACQLDDRHR